MDLRRLIEALLRFDALGARSFLDAAFRSDTDWSQVELPRQLDERQEAVAAGVVELLAQRAGQTPPPWTERVAPSPSSIYLVRSADTMPRLRRLCEEEGPEPLRRRRVFAPPEFLTRA